MNRITKNTNFADILTACPESAEILFSYGLHCIGCQFSPMETLEQGAKGHNLSDEQVEKILEKLNKAIR